MQMAKRLCGPRMIKSREAWLKTFFYKSGKTQRTLFSNTQIWSRVLSSKVPSEFKYYSQGTNSILKGTSPKELAAYSNRFVTQEVKVICPFWHASVVGACGVHKSEEKEMKASNAIALATSATSRTRNQRMSALASCISVILLLSGAKTQDFTRLNKLGFLCRTGRLFVFKQLWDITSMAKRCNGKRIERKFWVLWILVMKLCPSKSPCPRKTTWSWRYGATCLKIPSNCMSSSHQEHIAYSWKWEPSKLMMMMPAVYQIPQSRRCCQS